MGLPNHSTPEAAGPNQPIHEESIGQSLFTVQVLDKETNEIKDVTYTDPSTLHPGKYLMGIMLNRIMDLLITMVKTMQNVAVQQAQKMTFFTKMQNANTAQMNSVHTFTLNNSDPVYISGRGDDENVNRQALNQTNTTYIEQIRANNNLIANTAKQIQTNINQTQDAVNQQSNMLTSLIQQLRSINSSISRG
jgi:hypothetical protein